MQQAQKALPHSAPVEALITKAQQIKAQMALQAVISAPGAETPSKPPEAPTGQPNAAKPLQGNNLGAGTPQVTKVAEGVSGAGPKQKAMLDRLDELTNRVPKTGKERQDIAREIDQIKQLLSKDLTPEQAAVIRKRISDRESVARKRATAKAETPGATSTGAVEPTASGGDPEQQTMLIETGLKKLSTMGELGKETAKGLARDAKLRKWSAAEQMAQIAEAIEFLRTQQHEGESEVPLHPPEGDDTEK